MQNLMASTGSGESIEKCPLSDASTDVSSTSSQARRRLRFTGNTHTPQENFASAYIAKAEGVPAYPRAKDIQAYVRVAGVFLANRFLPGT